MSSTLLSSAVSLREALAGFELGLLSGTDCAPRWPKSWVLPKRPVPQSVCWLRCLLLAAVRGLSDGAARMARQVGGFQYVP
jgi:hypothetical protein